MTPKKLHIALLILSCTFSETDLRLVANHVDATRVHESDNAIWVVAGKELRRHRESVHIHRNWRTGHLRDEIKGFLHKQMVRMLKQTDACFVVPHGIVEELVIAV